MPRSFTSLQLLFLLRLQHLVEQRRQCQRLLDAGDYRLKMLDKAIYSTYCDCLEIGNGEDAKSLFQDPSVNRAEPK